MKWYVWLIIIVVVVLVVAFMISKYNLLVQERNKVKNAWSQIDVQLKRRFDLIPNLVATVKGYAEHEKSIWENFAKARQLYIDAAKENNIGKMADANNMITNTLSRLMVVNEQYPELKANENFKSLLGDLKDSEDKISFSRQFYNDIVLKYNNIVEMFPTNIIASIFKFKVAEFFKMNEAEKEAPKVEF